MIGRIGNYSTSGNIQADMLVLTWAIKSFARKDEWVSAGYTLEQYDEAQKLLKDKNLLTKAGGLMPKTKQILSSSGWGNARVETALKLVIKNL